MTTVKEPEVNWNQEMMVEVHLNEPDDFLKVRETLQELVLLLARKRSYINHVISCISKEDIILYILKNYLR